MHAIRNNTSRFICPERPYNMLMPDLKVISKMKPQGDQPAAIERLAANFTQGQKFNVLLGVTGSGKTFTMAHLIQRLQKPALIISHNKTLAAQLYEEMKELFPDNAVEYFVSYYDYYQPEAYIPQRDIYIEKILAAMTISTAFAYPPPPAFLRGAT